MKRRQSGPRNASFLAVLETRAPGTAEDLDYFPTPPWAARAGGELVRRIDPTAKVCWEPACGAGHMVHGLDDYFERIIASDIEDRGFGVKADFRAPDAIAVAGVDWIITNPPFNLAESFIRLALTRAAAGVAMLCRLAFLETIGRYALHYGETPLSVCAPFAERVPMHKGRWVPDGDTMTSYAWFIWLTPEGRAASPLGPLITDANAAGGFLTMGIAPGARERLTRRSDFDRFVTPAIAPLLDAQLAGTPS